MKLTKLMISAFVAAMTIVSCAKEEQPSVKNDYKSVKIEINNLFATKSSGTAIPDQTPITLNNFRIYLTDGDQIYYDATDESGTILGEAAYQFTNKPSGTINFHFVNPKVTKVVALANLTPLQYASIEDYADIKALKLNIGEQQDADALALFAEDELEQAGSQHVPTGDSHKEGENLITNVYKADLEFAPTVARFELDGFAIGFQSGANARFNKVNINQVAFNNYYPTVALYNSAVEGTVVDCEAENNVSAINYLTGNTGDDWYSDKETLTFERPSSLTPDTYTWVEKELSKTFYYHFFPTADAYPELMFQLSTEATDGTVSSTYIYTKNFKGVTSFEAGKIYRMSFTSSTEADNGDGDVPIGEDDIEQLEKCLDITVKVKNWNVVLVTPEF